MGIPFEIVKLYYGNIYTGYCTKPIKGRDFPKYSDWEEEYAIKIVDDSGKSIYFQLGSSNRSLFVTEV